MKKARNHFTRLCTLIMVLLMVFALAIVTSADELECYNHGDVNGDGQVDNRDAIYTLYHSLYGDQFYPINQDWDFNGDASKNQQDAIYLLYANLFPEDYELGGIVHSYYDPAWVWSSDMTQVSVTFKCSCGEDVTLHSDEEGSGITIEQTVTEAKCTTPGSVQHKATVEHDGKTYETVKESSIPATNQHTWKDGKEPGCAQAGECAVCGYQVAATGHNWRLVNNDEATCTADAVDYYVCDNCGDNKDVTLEGTKGHTFTALETHAKRDGCQYAGSKCDKCGTYGDIYTKHQYVAVIETLATCKDAGVKIYQCSCGAKQLDEDGNVVEVVIPKNQAHDWEEVTDVAGVTHKCKVCPETKLVVTADTEGKVNLTGQEDAVEVDLGGDTTVALDKETTKELGEIKITVESVPKTETDLSADQLAQIPGNTVYDFSMIDTAKNEAVTQFKGEVTISLPYTLAEGEDVDSIDIWYINDAGEVVKMENVTYNNGFVTFTTKHFSYYTVTRLTPAERCDKYGHIEEDDYKKDATCTENGYKKVICQRCGKVLEEEIYEAKGHDYTEVRQEPTCTVDGLLTKTCGREGCGHEVKALLLATGHSMKLDKEASVSASCKETGKKVYACDNENCDHKIEEILPKQEHSFVVSETVDATCSDKGYVKETCSGCGLEQTKEELAALGHHYIQKDWTWDDDYYGAELNLVCEHDETHTKSQFAIATQQEEKAVSCLGSGAMTYTVTLSVNGETFTDVKTVTSDAPGHSSDDVWHTNQSQHYHECTVCQTKIDTATHTWGEPKVTLDATCAEDGLQTLTCTVCGYEKEEVIPATAEHDFSFGVCRECGFRSDECDHEMRNSKQVNLDGYPICEGIVMYLYSCDCGEHTYLNLWDLYCNMEYVDEDLTVLEDGRISVRSTATCADCGLVITWNTYGTMLEGECVMQLAEEVILTLNGQELVRSFASTEDMTSNHPTYIAGETVDLTQYGLCAGALQAYTCPCGERVTHEQVEGCHWYYNNGEWCCEDCGATRTRKYEEVESDVPCQYVDLVHMSCSVDGVVVYTYTNRYVGYMHNYELDEYKLLGTSCEDGIFVREKCADCGKILEYYDECHMGLIHEEVDLSDYGICADVLYRYTCPCEIAYSRYYLEGDGCEWIWISADPDTNTEISQCSICGTIRKSVVTKGEKDDSCRYMANAEITFTDANGNSFTAHECYYRTEHNWEQTMELMGESCEDGIKITEYCTDCGHTDEYEEYWHRTQIVETVDLSQYDICIKSVSLYQCLCGEHSGTQREGDCENRELYWTDEGIPYWLCNDCGVVIESYSQYGERLENCKSTRKYTYRIILDGTVLVNFAWDEIWDDHNYQETYTLKEGATTCEDGVYCRLYCPDCGYEENHEIYYHEVALAGTQTYGEGVMCGTIVVENYTCACGYDTWCYSYTEGDSCQWEGTYSQELGCTVWTCTECGVSHWEDDTWVLREGETCWYDIIWTTHYTLNGEELFCTESHGGGERHDFAYTYQLQGETCDDGYYLTRTCTLCGFANTDEYPSYGCSRHEISEEVLATTACGDIILRNYSCVCGKETSSYVSYNCENWEWIKTDDGECNQCLTCGLQRKDQYEYTLVKEECREYGKRTTTYTLDGTVIAIEQDSWDYERHSYVCSFEGDCETGYYEIWTCQRCGNINQEVEEELYTGHNTCVVEKVDLSDYGMCGGEIYKYSCACGEETDVNYHIWECNWTDTDHYNEEHNTYARYCQTCNTYMYYDQESERVSGTCTYNATRWIKLVRDGETLLERTDTYTYESHNGIATSFVLNVDGGTCNDGYTIYWQCQDCSYAYSSEGWSDHATYCISSQRLSDTCEVTLRTYSCACGQNSYTAFSHMCSMSGSYWEEKGDDGYLHYYDEMECNDCGLKWYRDSYNVPIEGTTCAYTRYYTSSYVYDGVTVYTYSDSYETRIHDYKITNVALRDGATNCYEGIVVTETCIDCGEVWSHDEEWHVTMLAESYDLTQYGSVCGGSLEHYKCACGQEDYWKFSDDLKCDLDYTSVDHWVDNVIDEVSQCTSENYRWYDSASGIYTCAVTDPACSLKIRYADIWVQDGCMAIRYQIWQLGYDESTGTCQQEIKVVLDRRAYHDYTDSEISETLEDGTKVTGWLHTCATCGSTYADRYYFDSSDKHIRTETVAINTLYAENGENQSWTCTREIGFHGTAADGCVYNIETLTKDAYIRADGTEYWYQNEYAYDEDNFGTDCTCTITYTNSEGCTDSWVEVRHSGSRKWTYEAGTCTQDGVKSWTDYCVYCGLVEDTGSHPWNPIAHDWCWNDEKQTYVCTICGLENINGASGSIVLEDMTDNYDGSNYVVGYWNRDNVEYVINISVMLYDVEEGQDDQLVLSGITVTEMTDVRAISCSKSEVQAAVETALADYTGDYAIRISFVPVGGTTLDYAITFDTQTK